MAAALRNVLDSVMGRMMGLAPDGSLIVKGEPDQFVITATVGATNVTAITFQAKDNENNNFAAALPALIWLSDAATGVGLTTTTASGTVAAGAAGTDMGVLTTKKVLRVLTNTLGAYTLSITDTAKTLWYACGRLDAGRKPSIQTKLLTTANYGP